MPKEIGFILGIRLGIKRRFRPINPRQMPTINSHTMRQLADDDLLAEAAGWKPGTAQRLIHDFEIKRREGRTARLALLISFSSLIVSIVALIAKS